MRFDGQAVLVTGAGSGIGRATAEGFAARGARVAVADANGEAAGAVAAGIAAAGGMAMAIVADVSRPAEIDAMVERTLAAWGRVDVLHNNAFGIPRSPGARRLARVADMDDAVWDHTLRVGLTAVMQATRRVLPAMRAQGGGAIVNTASVSGLYGDEGIAAYNAMKGGVINFTRTVALEYARDGIRANCVCPGAIDTPLLRAAFAIPSYEQRMLDAIPMRRLGRPEEMANVVMFLASDLAAYVTGAAFVADGGLTIDTGIPSRFTA